MIQRLISKITKYASKFFAIENKRLFIIELIAKIKGNGIFGEKIEEELSCGNEININSQSNNLCLFQFDPNNRVTLPYSNTPKVTIIIPMYNQLHYTVNCINSIYLQSSMIEYEIIIADDNSTENSAILSDYFKNIRIIKNRTNLGFLGNCNNAVKDARGEYVVLLNNDTQVQQYWLDELLVVFENFKNTGLVGSKLVYPDGRLQEAGGIIWRDGSGWNYGNQDDPDKPEYNYVKEVDYISGASIMIKRTIWQELGGFDELFAPAYYEDTDLCFRIRQKGHKVMYQPFSVVVHFEGVSHGKDVSKGIKQYQLLNKKKFFDRWKNVLEEKSENAENVFSERDRSNGKKQILVVDHYLPQIDKDAGSRCISNFIDCMMELNYNIKFLGENQNSSLHYQKLFQEKGVEVLYGYDYNFQMQNWKNYLNKYHCLYDAILLSRSSVCLPIITFLRNNNYRGNIIYFGHDLGYLRLEQESIAKNDPELRKLAATIKSMEDFMYQNANNSLVLSYQELDFLKRYINRPMHYVPAYFFDVLSPVPPYERRDGLLFVGGFNHPPNQDAMKWFLSDVYETLYAQNIKLTIVGSLVPEFIFKFKEKFDSITILSDISIEALNDLYSQARIAIVPLQFGAGVKGKVIEAMSKGVPIVGTDIAFEGIPKDADFLYKGTNTAAEMAQKIIEVHSDKNKWEELSNFGCDYVLKNFNKENMKNVFKNIID